MMRSRRLRLGLALLALTLTATPVRPAPVPAPAAPRGLDQVPATAPLVLYVHGVERVKDRLLALLENALPEVQPLVKPFIEKAIDEGFDGRKLRGLAKDGPIFVAFLELPRPGEEPKVAIIAAVTSYAQFRDNLLNEDERKSLKGNGRGVEKAGLSNGEGLFFVDRKDYAILSPSEEVANSFTRQQPGLDGKISREQGARLLAGDLGLYLSMDAFNKQYAEQIKKAREGAEEGLKQLTGMASGGQKSMLEVVKNAIGPIFQAVEDSQGIVETVEFRPSGLAFHVQSEIRPGSPTAKVLQGAQPVAFEDLAQMPPGQMYYIGMQTGSGLFKRLQSLMYGFASDPESKEHEAVEAALEQLGKANPSIRLDAVNVPPQGIQLWHFEDPAAAVQAQTKLVKSLGAGSTFYYGTLKEKPAVKVDAETYRDFKLTSVRLQWDLEKMAEANSGGRALPEEAKKQMVEGLGKLLGDATTLWFGTDGKVFLQVTGKDWKAAEKVLDEYFKGSKHIGNVAAFRDVRKELPAQASLLSLIDLVQYFAVMADFAKPILGGVVPLPPNFPGTGKGKASYVGMAVTLEPKRGSFDFFLSAAATREFYDRFVKPLRGGN